MLKKLIVILFVRNRDKIGTINIASLADDVYPMGWSISLTDTQTLKVAFSIFSPR